MSLETPPIGAAAGNPLASHLADEANHRVANHLAMLAALMRLQAKGVGRAQIAFSAKDVQRVLEEFAGRLETVAEVHRLLAHRSSGAPVDVADYLERIAQGLVSSLTANGRMSIQCLFPVRFVLPAEQAVALGLPRWRARHQMRSKYSHPAGPPGLWPHGADWGGPRVFSIFRALRGRRAACHPGDIGPVTVTLRSVTSPLDSE